MSYKRATAILVPTENKSDLYLGIRRYPNVTLTHIRDFDYPNTRDVQKQNLYIVFDRNGSDISTHLNINDWYLVELYNVEGESIGMQLEQVLTIDDCWINNNSVEKTRHQDNCKKIIATTNKYLYINHIDMKYENITYPKTSLEFIEYFVKIFNEKNSENIPYYKMHNITVDKSRVFPILVKTIDATSYDIQNPKCNAIQFKPELDSNNCVIIKNIYNISPEILELID